MSEFTPWPVVYPARISSQCGQHNSDNEQLMEALQQVKQHIPKRVVTTSGHSSCNSILDNSTSASSGYYHVTTINDSTVLVYCDMEGTNCGGEGGWTSTVVYCSFGYIDNTTLLIQKSIHWINTNSVFINTLIIYISTGSPPVLNHEMYLTTYMYYIFKIVMCNSISLCTKTHEHRYTYIFTLYFCN